MMCKSTGQIFLVRPVSIGRPSSVTDNLRVGIFSGSMKLYCYSTLQHFIARDVIIPTLKFSY